MRMKLKGGHTHNHLRNAERRMRRRCTICDAYIPIPFGKRLWDGSLVCRECYRLEWDEYVSLVAPGCFNV